MPPLIFIIMIQIYGLLFESQEGTLILNFECSISDLDSDILKFITFECDHFKIPALLNQLIKKKEIKYMGYYQPIGVFLVDTYCAVITYTQVANGAKNAALLSLWVPFIA